MSAGSMQQLNNITSPQQMSARTFFISLLAAQVFHPNIDLDGNICLNILREDWKPVLSINSVIYGLQFLFLVSNRALNYSDSSHSALLPP